MKKQILSRFIFVLIIMLFGIILALPNSFYVKTLGADNAITKKLSAFHIALGLDLKGGTELDYKVDLSEVKMQNNDDDPSNDLDKQGINDLVESVRDALEKRVNPAGVGEIIVKKASVLVNGEKEEHVLIQMPPNTDIEKAKRDAEQNNKLEFFEEDPAQEKKIKLKIAKKLKDLRPYEFEEKAELWTKQDGVNFEEKGPLFLDEIESKEIAEVVSKLAKGKIAQKVIAATIPPSYKISADGKIEFDGLPVERKIAGILKLKDKIEKERTKMVKAKAKARHILFAYPGAEKAGDDVKYKSKEEAKAKAEEILAQLKAEGTDNFGDLAKEFSTEGAAQSSYGELGEFETGKMVKPFEEAVFAQAKAGLIPNLVETKFGFHIIEVESVQPEGEVTQKETAYIYEMIEWNMDEATWVRTKLGGKQLDKASTGYDQIGSPLINLQFDKEGGRMFADLTGRVASRKCNDGPCRLGIKVGGKWMTRPTVQQKIVGRSSQITGSFTFEGAKALANGLNLGAIDAPVMLSGQTTIQAELGADQLRKSLTAGAIGLIATMIFMVLMYRFAGIIAAISLITYTSLFVAILKLWPDSFGGPIVMSLAGAAGVALSIGLAVDGNILIFERMKEEIKRGRTLPQAIDLGFERAWTAIRDSNLTTLLICVILFIIGSSIIKGFAITLMLGTCLSMFTAIIVSRNLIRFALLFKCLQHPWLFAVKSSDIGEKSVGKKIRKRKKTTK